MNDRYQGRPLVRLLEYYFLWCIGELALHDERTLEARAPELGKILGRQGAWYEILESAAQLPPDMRSRISKAWRDHINKTSGSARRTPAEAAQEFVDDNFDIEPAAEPWPIEVH